MKRGPIIAVSVVVVALVAGWFLFIRNDAPPPVALDDAVAAATSTTAATTTTGETSTAAPDTSTTEATDSSGGSISGTWTVAAANSFAGYRIGEELANIGTIEAVGRTSEIEGSLTASESAITEVTVEVDMQTLESDRSQRDDALASRGLETDSFPTATFALTSPIELDAAPAAGDAIQTTATGDLTLHGVTNTVELDIEGQLIDDGTVVVVGSVDVALADYDIEPPTGFAVLSINEVGTLELQLQFERG